MKMTSPSSGLSRVIEAHLKCMSLGILCLHWDLEKRIDRSL